MDRLLHHIDLITRERDRSRLDAALLVGLHEVLSAETACLHKLHWSEGRASVSRAVEHDGESIRHHDDGLSGVEGSFPVERDSHLSDCLERRSAVTVRHLDDGSVVHAFITDRRKPRPSGFVSISRRSALTARECATALAVINVFCNCNDLLDYCEVDTLTGLLNRKTFDEHLFKILSRPTRSHRPLDRRNGHRPFQTHQ
jgi:hypothetical protein